MNLRQRDKQLHFGAGAIAAALAYLWSFWLLGREKKTLRFGFAVFTALAAGVAKEVYDEVVAENNYADLDDVLATFAGGVAAAVACHAAAEVRERMLTRGGKL